MKAVLQTIRILVITLLVETIRCQDGFERDLLRLQQLASNEAPVETITSYSTNIMQRDPNTQAMSSVSVQYHMQDDADKNEGYNRVDRGRTRKVYRIKNPFQQQTEDDGRQQDSQPGNQDSESGASNQYAAMQYSLPPEEFLRQMRAESQYYQQQQQPQVSTPVPSLGYTATPQPQYQYSSITATGYDNNLPQSNQIPQLEPKISQAQDYRSIANSYQYNGPNSYVESIQNTPSPIPPYVSTSNNQYIGTPANSYVSSSSPIYLSSPANVQFISSSIPAVPSGTPDYSNKITSTIGSNPQYESQEYNKKMQIDHYDNSANGMRYPTNYQQQYQSDYPTSTPTPSSTPYPDPVRDSWQNQINSALPKSLQEYPQYQKYSYYRNQQDSRSDPNLDSANSDTHRVGNMPAANNVFLNFAQPDYQALSNIRSRTRDAEHESAQPELYSHGEYGWKLTDRRPAIINSQSGYASAPSSNFPRYQSPNTQQENVAVSQMSFHMDTGRPQSYDHISKSSSDTDAQEFAKAAAKAHENMKLRQYYSSEYSQNYNTNNPASSGTSNNAYYGSNNDKQRNKIYTDGNGNAYYYSNAQPDLITASPYYFSNARENPSDEKPKQPFDHDKALKNIVPIDVSNVVQETQQKQSQGFDNNRYNNIPQYNRDMADSYKQNFKTITDHFYQDKNSAYGVNIKPRPEEGSNSDSFKLIDPVSQYFSKQPSQEQYYSQNSYSDNKRYVDSSSSSANYVPQQSSGFQDSAQSSANIQQQGIQRPQNTMPSDITSILKLNDIPYRLTQNLPSETFRLHSGNYEPVGLPTPLPLRLNQNVGSHQLDVASSILNKLMANKQPTFTVNRPGEIDPSLLTTVNGFKVANPYNVDLKLVADMLKGKPSMDDSHILGLRDQFVKPPIKFDISQLQQLLLKNDNPSSLDGFGLYNSPFIDIYNNGRFPYQGVKYSRSQEEEETVIPIGESSNNHPIGAVVEQDDPINGREVSAGTELTAQEDDTLSEVKFSEENSKATYSPGHRPDRHKHPNLITPGRHGFPRKYPKESREPYAVLKPPPPHSSRGRNVHNKNEKHGRRRRVKRPKLLRVMKHEPVYDTDGEESSEVSFLLRPPPPNAAEAKSDVIETEPSA